MRVVSGECASVCAVLMSTRHTIVVYVLPILEQISSFSATFGKFRMRIVAILEKILRNILNSVRGAVMSGFGQTPINSPYYEAAPY